MTQQHTDRLKFEIKRFVDVIGMNFNNVNWLNQLSSGAKFTLQTYFEDVNVLSKRDIAILLYQDKDSKLWDLIMSY